MKKLGNGTGSVYKLSGKRSKPWAARKTVGWNEKGQPKYKFIGFYKTRTEAMNALTAYNKSPYSLEGERLCDMYEQLLKEFDKKLAPGTVKNKKAVWTHMKELHEERISDLSRKKLQIYFDGLNVTQPTKEKIKMLLHQIMDYSIRYDVIQPERIVILDYIDLSSSVAERKIARKVFEPNEIELLKSSNDEIAKTILFLIYTGLRIGELFDSADNIDDDMVIHIEKSKTASGIRLVPLSDKAQKLLPLPKFETYGSMRYMFDKYLKQHNLDHTMHDTRHTCVSLLANAGVDKRIIQTIVGHRGNDVTDNVYTHITIETMREALNKI